MKFLPSYLFSAETLLPSKGGQPGNVTVELPITCDFEVRRGTLASAQTGCPGV